MPFIIRMVKECVYQFHFHYLRAKEKHFIFMYVGTTVNLSSINLSCMSFYHMTSSLGMK